MKLEELKNKKLRNLQELGRYGDLKFWEGN